jgi:hypothetical protein
MARDWEATFRSWSGPSSATEQDKMENAERQIRAAIRESKKLVPAKAGICTGKRGGSTPGTPAPWERPAREESVHATEPDQSDAL